MIGRTNVGGGGGSGPSYPDLTGIIDGTLTSLVIPEGITTIRQYLCYRMLSLTELVLPSTLTTVEQYAFHFNSGETPGLQNKIVELPAGLKSVGTDAFYYSHIRFKNGAKITNPTLLGSQCFAYTGQEGTFELEENAEGTPINIGSYAFRYGCCTKLTGEWKNLETSCFSVCSLSHVDIKCTKIGNSAISETSCSYMHILINGAIEMYGLRYNHNLTDVHIHGVVTSIGNYAFTYFGDQRRSPNSNILVLDFSQGTFTSLGSQVFGASSHGPYYWIIRLPSTLASCTSSYTFGYTRNSYIFFPRTTPPTIQSNTFTSSSANHFFVPYDNINAYKTAANWNTVSNQIYGYAPPNTFQDGDTLPTVNAEGYTLTWYSDMATTNANVITVITDATQEVYCKMGSLAA